MSSVSRVPDGARLKEFRPRNGRELFYRNGDGQMVAVAVSAGNAAPPTGEHRVYDASPDGRRFVMVQLGAHGEVDEVQLIVVENFFEKLKRTVPRR